MAQPAAINRRRTREAVEPVANHFARARLETNSQHDRSEQRIQHGDAEMRAFALLLLPYRDVVGVHGADEVQQPRDNNELQP